MRWVSEGEWEGGRGGTNLWHGLGAEDELACVLCEDLRLEMHMQCPTGYLSRLALCRHKYRRIARTCASLGYAWPQVSARSSSHLTVSPQPRLSIACPACTRLLHDVDSSLCPSRYPGEKTCRYSWDHYSNLRYALLVGG